MRAFSVKFEVFVSSDVSVEGVTCQNIELDRDWTLASVQFLAGEILRKVVSDYIMVPLERFALPLRRRHGKLDELNANHQLLNVLGSS